MKMKMMLLAMMLVTVVVPVSRAQTAAEKLAEDKTQISLADARGKIDKAIESPAVMKEIMRRLSAEDQVKFLADVNKAIGDMPASSEEKAAKFLNVNHVALTVAQKGNTTALLAEVFATVSPDALPVISERFAIDLLNRAADSNVTYSDDQFKELAIEIMKKINDRTEETDNGSARSTFAILMFGRASNLEGDSLEKFQDELVDTLKHDDAKDLAREEWIPAATGKDGREQGYEPLLASADAGRRPDFAKVLVIAGPQYLESILADITGKNTDQMAFIDTRSPVLDAVENTLVTAQPMLGADFLGVAGEAGNAAEGGGQELGPHGENPRPTPENLDPTPLVPTPVTPTPEPPAPHPGPYSWQR